MCGTCWPLALVDFERNAGKVVHGRHARHDNGQVRGQQEIEQRVYMRLFREVEGTHALHVFGHLQILHDAL